MKRLLILLIFFSSCAPSNHFSRKYVSDKLSSVTNHDIPADKKAGAFDVPGIVNYADGIDKDEAVALALWNNAQFQTDLTDIAIADADLTDASIIANPLLRYLSPNAGIMMSGYINFAVDFLWQRPQRIAAARADAHRRADNLVQRGLVLVRDVHTAFADQLLAQHRLSIYSENLQIRSKMRQLVLSRLHNGEISELEANTFFVDSLNANDILIRSMQDTLALTTRLNTLLGLAPDTTISFSSLTIPERRNFSKDDVMTLAQQYNPELAVVATQIEAVGKRLGWERSRIINFTATLNMQHLAGKGGSEYLPNAANPGFQAEIPLFNRNQGRIKRARAELEQASFQYVATSQRVTQNITEAYYRYQQAYNSYLLWNGDIIPSLRRAVDLSQRAYELGETSFLPVLDAMRQWLDARLRKSETEAELVRAVANLNYSIGKNYINF